MNLHDILIHKLPLLIKLCLLDTLLTLNPVYLLQIR